MTNKTIVLTSMTLFAMILLTSTLIFSTETVSATTNLVTNGSFEEPANFCASQPNPWHTIFGGSTQSDWTVTGHSVEWVCPSGFWTIPDGEQAIDLDGSGPGGLGQVLQTVPGETYDVSFEMAGNVFCGDTIKDIEFIIGSQSETYSWDSTGEIPSALNWETHTLSYTATDSSTQIQFNSLDNNLSCGPMIDNVVVEPALVTETITLRSDSSNTFLDGPAGAPFSNVFTTADFDAARNGPNAYEIPRHPAWRVQLSDGTNTWIGTANVNSNGPFNNQLHSALYAVDFEVTTNVDSATLDILYSADNSVGWTNDPSRPAAATNGGVFINGQEILGAKSTNQYGSNFAIEGSSTGNDIASMLTCGTNTLYVYVADYGPPSGLLYSADITLTGSGQCTPEPQDTTAPVVTVSSETAEATGPGGASVIFTATAQDDTDGALVPTCNATSGDTFPIGTTTVTCTATDAAGNTGTGTGTITVQDKTAPIITLLGNDPANAECAVSYSDAGSTAFDIVDLDLTASIVTGGLPVDTSSVGSSTVTYDVSDNAGNAADQVSRTVNVEDTTNPTVTAALVPFGNIDDDDEGKFIVKISGSDSCDVSPTITANLNGIPVTNGQPVKLEVDDETESKFKEAKDKQCTKAQKEADKKIAKGKPIGDGLAWKLLVCEAGGELQLEDLSFVLTVTATDSSGNSNSATANPTFPVESDDDDDDD